MSQLANFFVVGAAKAATTALCNGLAQHPDVFFPKDKEPHHFVFPSNGEPAGLDFGVGAPGLPLEKARFLKSRSSYAALFECAGAPTYRGDGSTQYFVSEIAADRIAEEAPDARILIQLREPLARAWSAFTFAQARGEEKSTFLSALQQEEAGHRSNRFYGGYLNTSDYGRHVLRWFDKFGADRVLVTYAEDFRNDPQAVYDCIFSWLGVAKCHVPQSDRTQSNATVVVRNPVLHHVRTLGRSLRSRHDWIGRLPVARAVHGWILNQGEKPTGSPSSEEVDFFREALLARSKQTPLASVIGPHPYEGV